MTIADRYYSRCLMKELEKRIKKNPRYSLRSFARALEVDPAALSRVLSGARVPTPEFSRRVMKHLALTPRESKLFLLSMAKAYQEGGEKRKPNLVKQILAKPHSSFPMHDLAPDLFRMIADWHHFAILQLIHTRGFRPEARWIAQQLSISEIEAKLALQRLQELEVINWVNDTWERVQERVTAGDPAITTPAHRKRIRQTTLKSLESLENDPIEERNHTSRTLSIDPEKMPIAKSKIQKFMNDLADEMQTDKKQVYELQVHFFPLQKKEPAL